MLLIFFFSYIVLCMVIIYLDYIYNLNGFLLLPFYIISALLLSLKNRTAKIKFSEKINLNIKFIHYIKAQSMYNYLNRTYNSFELKSGIINYGIIAQSDNGGKTISHVDVVYNRHPGNQNYQHWGTTFIFAK